MTDLQLSLSIGSPTFAVLIGILLNGFLYNSLNTGLNCRMSSLETRMLFARSDHDGRFDLIIGKLMELDNRLSVL